MSFAASLCGCLRCRTKNNSIGDSKEGHFMIQPYRFAAAAVALLLALASAPAQAGLVTDVIDFTASNFTPTTAGVAVPKDPVSGEITIVFDPTVSTSQST